MRVVWLTPLFLACTCISLASADDQPSCGAYPSEQSSDCSVAPTLLRVSRGVKDTSTSTFTSTRGVKHKRRVRPHKKARVARSTQEDSENTDEEGVSQHGNPRLPYSKYQEQLAHVPGEWRHIVRQIQTPAYVATPRYCPHCRQLLPPEPAFLHHPVGPVDSRMVIPIQTPRFQAISINRHSPFESHEEFSNSNGNIQQSFHSEESCPFNYRTKKEESEAHPPDYFNHTTPSPNKRKEFKKSPAGLSDVSSDSTPSESPKLEMASTLKQSKLPTVEELTKYLEKKNNT